MEKKEKEKTLKPYSRLRINFSRISTMAIAKGSNGCSDRAKWNKIFNAMVHMLQNQQTQLQYLVRERKLREDITKLQQERWVFHVNLLQDQILEMKRDFNMQEKERVVEATKADMAMGLKIREAFLYKHKFENADGELADFREWFEYLSRKCSEEEGSSSDINRYKALENELRKLKCENEKLKLDKKSEFSDLLADKSFVWNEFNLMETNLNEQLRRKHADVESANEKIHALLSSMEKLQSSNSLKDKMIGALKEDFAKLNSDSVKKDKEVSRLSRELESLRKSRNDSVTPVLRHCTTKSGNIQSKGKSGRTMTVKKELDSSHAFKKGCQSSKRKAVDTIHIFDTPKLFTSSFKVPKLKSPSPAVR